MKKLIALLIVFVIMILPYAALAAPETVGANDYGTTSSLIVMKKPETLVSSTTKQNYTLSGITYEGAEVALYQYNSSTGVFNLKRDGAGNPMVSYIGASGIYLRDIQLGTGTNYYLVRTQYGEGYYQTVRLDIKLLNQGLLDSIKGYATSFKSMFGGF